MIRMENPTLFKMFTSTSVLYILYYSFYCPIVRVAAIPNIQIRNVRHTSAKERETGLILFEMVTAIGTDIAIENISPMLNITKRKLLLISLKYVVIFSI
jgi:hypothetical protein